MAKSWDEFKAQHPGDPDAIAAYKALIMAEQEAYNAGRADALTRLREQVDVERRGAQADYLQAGRENNVAMSLTAGAQMIAYADVLDKIDALKSEDDHE